MNQDPFVAAVRAVDVGYFNVKYTLGRKDDGTRSVIKADLFPALAPRLDSPEIKRAPGERKADGCCVVVDESPFWVGRDAMLNASGIEPRPVLDNYSSSDQYLALLRGAMHYMLLDAEGHQEMLIRDLVVGLPLTTYATHNKGVAARCGGVHEVDAGGSRRVRVERVHVIPQPLGSLMNFGVSGGRSMEGWTLVVDVGGGTVDWYVATKRIANFKRSGAHAKGMLACAEAVARAENPRWLDQYGVMQRIDEALREGRESFRAAGQDWPLAKYRKAVEGVLNESLGKMLAKVEETDDIDRILLTGGGARAFGEVLCRRRPDLANRICMEADPVYSNVRGFQIHGEFMAKRGSHAAR